MRRAAVEQPLPIIIDLCLIGAAHEERDGFGKFEVRPAVEPHERLSLELEGGGEGLAIRPFLDVGDAGIAEDGGVELDGVFELVVEPEKRRDLLHDGCSLG
ncbi:hypothetical protein D3C72_2139150 [compost metagenome]